jgi:hypothetical protein
VPPAGAPGFQFQQRFHGGVGTDRETVDSTCLSNRASESVAEGSCGAVTGDTPPAPGPTACDSTARAGWLLQDGNAAIMPIAGKNRTMGRTVLLDAEIEEKC